MSDWSGAVSWGADEMSAHQFCVVCMAFAGGVLATSLVPVFVAPFSAAAGPRFDRSCAAVLEYHWTWRMTSAGLAFVPLFVFPVVGIYAKAGVGGWIALASATVVMSGFAIVVFVETSRVRVTVDDEGILTKSPWHRECRLRWDEITGITWRFMNGLELRFHGQKMIVPQHVQGMAYLFDTIRSRVPRDVYRGAGVWSLAR